MVVTYPRIVVNTYRPDGEPTQPILVRKLSTGPILIYPVSTTGDGHPLVTRKEQQRMPNGHSETEQRLWSAADELRANSKLKSSEYSVPVLGLIFLRYADHRFTQAQKELEAAFAKKGSGSRRTIDKRDYQAKGVMYLPEQARFSYLLNHATGSAYPAVNSGDFEKATILVPSQDVLAAFFAQQLLQMFSAFGLTLFRDDPCI